MSLNTGTHAEIQSKRGGRRPGAGRPRAPGTRLKPDPPADEEAVYEAIRATVNDFLGSEPAPSMDDVANVLVRLLARARQLQREA